MAKFSIYYGKAKPMVAVGENQCRLLAFAEKYQCWHSYNPKCRATVRAITRLHEKGYLFVNFETQDFKIKYP